MRTIPAVLEKQIILSLVILALSYCQGEADDGEKPKGPTVAPAPVVPAAGAEQKPSAGDLVIPALEFLDVPLDEAIKFLCAKSRELDPAKKGVNVVIKPGVTQQALINLRLIKVPIDQALHYIAKLAGGSLTMEDGVFVIAPSTGD